MTSTRNTNGTNTAPLKMYLDRIEFNYFLMGKPNQILPSTLSLPKELVRYTQEKSLYKRHYSPLQRSIYSWALSVGSYRRKDRATSTNGATLVRAARSDLVQIPNSKKVSKKLIGEMNNELRPDEIEWLDAAGARPWATQSKLLLENYVAPLLLWVRTRIPDIKVAGINLKRIEFYVQLPASSEVSIKQFQRMKKSLASELGSPVLIKEPSDKNAVFPEEYIRWALPDLRSKTLKQASLKFYRKVNTYRLELRMEIKHAPITSFEGFNDQIKDAAKIAEKALAKLFGKLSHTKLRRIRSDAGAIKKELCEKIEQYGFKSLDQERWRLFFVDLCQDGAYTPTHYPERARLSSEQLRRLTNSRDGILRAINSSKSFKTYSLIANWTDITPLANPSRQLRVEREVRKLMELMSLSLRGLGKAVAIELTACLEPFGSKKSISAVGNVWPNIQDHFNKPPHSK